MNYAKLSNFLKFDFFQVLLLMEYFHLHSSIKAGAGKLSLGRLLKYYRYVALPIVEKILVYTKLGLLFHFLSSQEPLRFLLNLYNDSFH